MQGRLSKKRIPAEVTSSCAHCGASIRIETDGYEMASATRGSAPLVFAPLVDLHRLRAKSIIDDF
ncbi:MAG TPA: hypothetical protein VMK12_13025 [Anaeromyxobacteraceae bacterium]|nr:hypothetical protein [Anaeromyxobacteraceae bacterium]